MKSLRSRNKKKKTFLQRAKKAYKELPDWAKKALGEDKDFFIKDVVHSKKIGYDIDPDTGKHYTFKRMLTNIAKKRAKRTLNLETKQYLFRRFRQEEPAVYAKYNSYMYRNGYSSAKYFYDNVTLKKDKDSILANLILPKAKPGRFSYSELEIFCLYSPKEDGRIEAYLYI